MLSDQDDISERKGRDGIRMDKDKGGDRDGDGLEQSSVKAIRRSVRRGGVSRDRGTYKALIPILESVAAAATDESDRTLASDSASNSKSESESENTRDSNSEDNNDNDNDSVNTIIATATLASSLPLTSTTDVYASGVSPSLISLSPPVTINRNLISVETQSTNRSIRRSEKERKRAEEALETVRRTGRMEGLVFS